MYPRPCVSSVLIDLTIIYHHGNYTICVAKNTEKYSVGLLMTEVTRMRRLIVQRAGLPFKYVIAVISRKSNRL